MPEVTVEQQNEIESARRRALMRERAQIFREVFGVPPNLTKHGKIILEALESSFGKGLPKNLLDDHGRTDLWQTVRRLGHYDVIESIYDTIRWKESEHVNPSKSGIG